MKRVLMLGTFLEYFRDWLFNIISCSHFTHVRLLGWQNCLLCIWTPQERIKRTIRVDFNFWSSALLRFFYHKLLFQGCLKPCSQEYVRVIVLTQWTVKAPGDPVTSQEQKKSIRWKKERGPDDRNLMNALPSSRTSDQALFLESHVPYILHQQCWDNTLRVIP